MFKKVSKKVDLPLTRWKKSTADKGRTLPKGRQDTETSTSFRVTALVVEQPGNVDSQSWEDAARCQVDGCIPSSCLGLVLDSCQHQVANGTHGREASNEPASLAILVRAPGCEQATQEGEKVSRCCQSLGINRAVAHVADNRW